MSVMSSSVCRVCLCGDVRMHSIEDNHLVEIYETMSGSKLNTEYGWPTTVCYICVSQLRRCRRLYDRARETEKTLIQLYQNRLEVPCNVRTVQLAATHNLSVKALPYLDLIDNSRMSDGLEVEEEKVVVKGETVTIVVKEETAEDEDPLNIAESRLVDIGESALDDVAVDTEQRVSDIKVCSQNFTCDMCNKNLSCKQSLIRHIKSHTKIKPYVCKTCNKPFTQNSHLKRHIKLFHPEEKAYICRKCKKAFRDSGNLKEHMKAHVKETRYICNQCNKVFNSTSNLNKHMRIHSGVKPYACNICNMGFRQAIALKIHNMYKHTGEKPFACSQCNKAFIDSYNLKVHMRIHTGAKPYVCNQCNKAFNRVGYLKLHMRIHTGEKPYVCNICNKAFNQGSNLKKHMKVHNDE